MVTRSARERLSDIESAIRKIDRFLADGTFETFCADERTHDAVVRNLEVISEACRHLPAELKAEAPEIPWRDIAGFGNFLRHGYESVSDVILWDTIKRDLPPLLTTVRGFLSRPDA